MHYAADVVVPPSETLAMLSAVLWGSLPLSEVSVPGKEAEMGLGNLPAFTCTAQEPRESK